MCKVSHWGDYNTSQERAHNKSVARSVAHLRGRLHALLLLHVLHHLLILLLVHLLLLAVAAHLQRGTMALRISGPFATHAIGVCTLHHRVRLQSERMACTGHCA